MLAHRRHRLGRAGRLGDHLEAGFVGEHAAKPFTYDGMVVYQQHTDHRGGRQEGTSMVRVVP
ncbi:hypothetical protein GCM10009780_66320 [Actinomadura alba]